MKNKNNASQTRAISMQGLVCYSRRATLALFLIYSGSQMNAAAADEMSLLVNGKAVHMNTPNGVKLNENNWGLGLQYDWDAAGKQWFPFAMVSGFSDSNWNPSYYAGGGALRRFQFDNTRVDLGVIGFVMTRKGYKNGEPFLGVLPAFSVGTKSVAMNMTYIPKVEPKAVPLWFFQLKINLDNFR